MLQFDRRLLPSSNFSECSNPTNSMFFLETGLDWSLQGSWSSLCCSPMLSPVSRILGPPLSCLLPHFCQSTYIVSSWGGVNWRQMLKSLPVSKDPFSPFIPDLYLGSEKISRLNPTLSQNCVVVAPPSFITQHCWGSDPSSISLPFYWPFFFSLKALYRLVYPCCSRSL